MTMLPVRTTQTIFYEISSLGTGSGISRFFNIQNQKYQTVSCTKCGFTELYRLDGSGFGNVIDLFAG
jgi:predicted nucleic-acid-binding Zn-ribbon protein